MRALALMILLLAGSAKAAPAPPTQTATASADRAVPQSVWRLDGVEAEHLQSGLRCPGMVEGWPRAGLTVYDGYGFDVSCGYNSPPNGAVVTLYLFKRVGLDAAAAYEEAKAQFMEHGVLPNRRLLSESPVPLGGVAWRKAAYAGDGDMRSDIWMANLSDWLVEYRATYPAASETKVNVELEHLTRMTLESAGPRLALCARSGEPVRRGKPATRSRTGPDMALVGALIGAGAASGANGKADPVAPVVHCVEGPVAGAAHPVLAWRGVNPDGSDAKTDRATLMTMGPPPKLDIALDETAGLIAAEISKAARSPELWKASIETAAGASIYGYFDGRPPTSVTAKLLLDILDNKAKPVSGYARDGENINITIQPR